MKIEGDYAIIETAEEASCFGLYLLDMCEDIFCHGITVRVDKPRIRSAITPKEGDPVFLFGNNWTSYLSPDYSHSWEPKKKMAIKANALTIGKTVGELRELLAWMEEK